MSLAQGVILAALFTRVILLVRGWRSPAAIFSGVAFVFIRLSIPARHSSAFHQNGYHPTVRPEPVEDRSTQRNAVRQACPEPGRRAHRERQFF
jgi:hypothetical protein